jgi:hypothetical protein
VRDEQGDQLRRVERAASPVREHDVGRERDRRCTGCRERADRQLGKHVGMDLHLEAVHTEALDDPNEIGGGGEERVDHGEDPLPVLG